MFKGAKSVGAGNGLRERGIPSVKLLVLAERKSWYGLRKSFFVMEASEIGQELDRYGLKRLDNFKKRRLFIRSFDGWLSHFHKMDLYYKDMKICNILVVEKGETWDFHLLDLEDVLLDEKVNERKLFKNLLQLNAPTPKGVTQRDRYRFFRQYLSNQPIPVDEKQWIRKIVEETQKRGILYVAPWGVVEEDINISDA